MTIHLLNATASGGHAAGDTLTDIENLIGSDFADTLTGNANDNTLEGGAGDDTLIGGAGADTLDGGEGIDTASYATSNSLISVNLLTGEVSGGHAEGDTLSNIENLIGSIFNDALRGDGNANILRGGEGSDALYGEGGADTLYGDGGSDLLYGGADGDTLYGDGSADTLYGDGGNDTLIGGAGADTLDGGADNDTASYATLAAGITISLTTGRGSSGDANGDRLSNIENLIGSDFGDTLTGDRNANILEGGSGLNILTGGAGDDKFVLKRTADTESRDDVTDFTSGDVILVNTTSGSELTLPPLLVALSIYWTNDSNFDDSTSSTNASDQNDTLIYHFGADGARGGGDDILMMVLEDYSEELTIADFEIV